MEDAHVFAPWFCLHLLSNCVRDAMEFYLLAWTSRSLIKRLFSAYHIDISSLTFYLSRCWPLKKNVSSLLSYRIQWANMSRTLFERIDICLDKISLPRNAVVKKIANHPPYLIWIAWCLRESAKTRVVYKVYGETCEHCHYMVVWLLCYCNCFHCPFPLIYKFCRSRIVFPSFLSHFRVLFHIYIPNLQPNYTLTPFRKHCPLSSARRTAISTISLSTVVTAREKENSASELWFVINTAQIY